MAERDRARRGPAAEAIHFRIEEGPPRPPPAPFTLTYLGSGVVAVEGVGLFTRWTRAAVSAEVARRYSDSPDWRVEPS